MVSLLLAVSVPPRPKAPAGQTRNPEAKIERTPASFENPGIFLKLS
jgi:hypothetical protein